MGPIVGVSSTSTIHSSARHPVNGTPAASLVRLYFHIKIQILVWEQAEVIEHLAGRALAIPLLDGAASGTVCKDDLFLAQSVCDPTSATPMALESSIVMVSIVVFPGNVNRS